MKHYRTILLLLVLLLSVSSCSYNQKTAVEYPVQKNVARQKNDDGWVFTFVYEYEKDGVEPIDGLINFYFFGINIRYRYSDKYVEQYQSEDSISNTEKRSYQSGVLIWGRSEETAADRTLIDDLLMNANKDELLALEEDSIEFSSLDKKMFFRLMREALNGEPQRESQYQSDWDRPTYAALVEKEFLDGYKFQVCFLNETGLIDECYIDVLYKTGEGETDYIQLSDLVEKGKASDGQIRCFNQLQKLSTQIIEQNTFLAEVDHYKEMQFNEIEMKRLNVMLDNLQKNEYMQYIADPVL